MNLAFVKATKSQGKLRLAIAGPSGSGKTFSALAIGTCLGSKVALIDTEHGSASKYADKFAFDTLQLTDFNPENYVAAIKLAEKCGYEVIILDSLSHAWSGAGGALEQVDIAAAKNGNTYVAWRKVTPVHNALVEAMLQSSAHIIANMRSKVEYAQEKDAGGKTVIRKVGMAPIQREGMEYEFDVFLDLDVDHNATVSKTRCSELADRFFRKPGEEVAKLLLDWLSDGAAEPPGKAPAPEAVAPASVPVACASCGEPILAGTDGKGVAFTAEKMVQVSKKGYQQPLCYACFRRVKDGEKIVNDRLNGKDEAEDG